MRNMTKTLAVALRKVKKLPDEMQDRFGFALIERVVAWHALREKIAAGARELDAGLGKSIDIHDVIRRARQRHGKTKK